MTNLAEEENEMGCINHTLLYKKYKHIDVMIYKDIDTWVLIPTIGISCISRISRNIYKPVIWLRWINIHFAIYFNKPQKKGETK